MDAIEVEADHFTVRIEEHESYMGFDDEPTDVGIKVTIKDKNDREVVVIGMDDEIERLGKAITDALTAKRKREQRQAEEENLERLRQNSAKQCFRIRGEVDRALRYLGVREEYTEAKLENGDNEVVVLLPNDSQTLNELRYLQRAYCIEWEAVEKAERAPWVNQMSEGF